MKQSKALLFALLAAALPTALAAESDVPMFADLVEEFAEDYKPVGSPVDGRLVAEDQKLVMLKVPANGNYMLMAACDDECFDIDLTLFDANGDMLYTDVYDDDYPVVYGEDLKAGTTIYALVGMYDCLNEDEGCFYRLGLFAEK